MSIQFQYWSPENLTWNDYVRLEGSNVPQLHTLQARWDRLQNLEFKMRWWLIKTDSLVKQISLTLYWPNDNQERPMRGCRYRNA